MDVGNPPSLPHSNVVNESYPNVIGSGQLLLINHDAYQKYLKLTGGRKAGNLMGVTFYYKASGGDGRSLQVRVTENNVVKIAEWDSGAISDTDWHARDMGTFTIASASDEIAIEAKYTGGTFYGKTLVLTETSA